MSAPPKPRHALFPRSPMSCRSMQCSRRWQNRPLSLRPNCRTAARPIPGRAKACLRHAAAWFPCPRPCRRCPWICNPSGPWSPSLRRLDRARGLQCSQCIPTICRPVRRPWKCSWPRRAVCSKWPKLPNRPMCQRWPRPHRSRTTFLPRRWCRPTLPRKGSSRIRHLRHLEHLGHHPPVHCPPWSPSGTAKRSRSPEYLVHRLMQRVDLVLDQRLRDAIATVVQQQTRSIVVRLREEVESVVRQAVYEAVADELAHRASAARGDAVQGGGVDP